MNGFFELTLKGGAHALINREAVTFVTDDPSLIAEHGQPTACLVNVYGQVLAVREPYDVVVRYVVGHV